ncbi:GMC family oxidoreductase (plasmid) [Photobacterium sp. DA100]|uniref:GMC family oxidoreductase N-terminal domain-containing protein n=1 Tax=Photobacterium sp. DA100 TaxID=3027472 RepID=UPI002479BDCF|nr:GMC family oxidoreductase [Photobacterium sp. DA100]WEM44345.1 GMC family oxidoreductase [Photobacterium sp. DA100]
MAIQENAYFDAIIVGSGPAGATLAKSLSEQGKKVLILEWGSDSPLRGSFWQMADIAAIPSKGAFIGKDLSLLIRGITAGGSSAINYATAMLPPYDMFDRYGIDLRAEAEEMQQAVPYRPLPDPLVGPRAKRIWQGAEKAGFEWHKLDKFIDVERCQAGCHLCGYGCPHGAKWTARRFLEDAVTSGAQLITKAKVTRVLTENQPDDSHLAIGVEYQTNSGVHLAFSERVILSAGGIGSPQILQQSGIAGAGQQFFIDPVIAVMGTVDEKFSAGEVPMAAGLHLPEEGIVLSDLALPKPFFHLFTAQAGRFDRLLAADNTLAIMVKVKDSLSGKISANWASKSLCIEDKARLDKGAEMAETILTAAGATHIYRTHHFAAHQGGSAAISDIVDSNLETEIKRLYVCDASVIPEAWGLPPTFTLLCLAKRLSKHLANHMVAN